MIFFLFFTKSVSYVLPTFWYNQLKNNALLIIPAGVPALTLPVKLSTSNSLPLSVQLIGPYLSDERILDLGKFIEEKVDFPALQLDDDYID